MHVRRDQFLLMSSTARRKQRIEVGLPRVCSLETLDRCNFQLYFVVFGCNSCLCQRSDKCEVSSPRVCSLVNEHVLEKLASAAGPLSSLGHVEVEHAQWHQLIWLAHLYRGSIQKMFHKNKFWIIVNFSPRQARRAFYGQS